MAKVMYDGKVVCEVTTNHSMTIDEMINLCFDDFEEEERKGTPGFYEYNGYYLFDIENATIE